METNELLHGLSRITGDDETAERVLHYIWAALGNQMFPYIAPCNREGAVCEKLVNAPATEPCGNEAVFEIAINILHKDDGEQHCYCYRHGQEIINDLTGGKWKPLLLDGGGHVC